MSPLPRSEGLENESRLVAVQWLSSSGIGHRGHHFPGSALSVAAVVSGDLAAGQKSGYVFTVAASKEGYTISAVPQIFGQTGRRTFFSDQTMAIRENWGSEPATAQSKEIK